MTRRWEETGRVADKTLQGIQGLWILTTAQIPSRNPSRSLWSCLSADSPKWPTGNPQHSACLTPTQPCGQLSVHVPEGRKSLGRQWACIENQADSEGCQEATYLNFSSTSGKTKGRLSESSLGCIAGWRETYKFKNSLKREKKKCGASVFIEELRKPQIPNRAVGRYLSRSQFLKTGGGYCYFKCEDRDARFKGTWKIKEIPKDHNNLPITDP